ncbi:MAG: hypothetical protein ACK5SQ_12190 [Chitinophagales bacterium]
MNNVRHNVVKKTHKDTDKKAAGSDFVVIPFLLLPQFQKILVYSDMSDIKNTRGKGYCMLYLLMGLFFFISLVLMLCNRGEILDFAR